MPIQGDNYVAPEWKNDQPPAISASELNDISNTLEKDWRRTQVLSENTAQVFGLDASATPDQVFSKIAEQFGKTINVTVTIDGSPAEGIVVEGITKDDGSQCITDSFGKTSGNCATATTKITAKSKWFDVDDTSKTVDTSEVETDASIAMTSKSSGSVKFTKSTTGYFTNKRTTIEYCIVGGGAGGSLFVDTSQKVALGGSGGGACYTGTFQNDGSEIRIEVGAGGERTYVKDNDTFTQGINGSITKLYYGSTREDATGGRAGKYEEGSSGEAATGSGGNGGSGGGSAYVSSRNTTAPDVGDGGYNGSDGGGRDAGTGQGTSTTYDGVTYSSGSGAVAVNYSGGNAVANPGYGAGKSVYSESTSPNTCYDGAIAGAAGGPILVVARVSDKSQFKTSAGADGAVILKWTV